MRAGGLSAGGGSDLQRARIQEKASNERKISSLLVPSKHSTKNEPFLVPAQQVIDLSHPRNATQTLKKINKSLNTHFQASIHQKRTNYDLSGILKILAKN